MINRLLREKFFIMLRARRAMFFPLVMFAGIIIVGLAYAFHQYRVAQIAMTDEIARFYAATCVAEAGISCAIAELRGNAVSWKTHNINNDATLSWGAAIAHNNVVQPAGILASFDGANGTATGKFGQLGEFKVRCGLLPAKDNPDTKAVNESNMFYKIESLGCYVNTYVKVSTVVEARNLSEFLVYDGDFLDMVLGVSNSVLPDAANHFRIGTLYGKQFVFLGTVNGGPQLEFKDMTDIMTGSTGEIYTFDNRVVLNTTQLDRTANSSKNLIAPAQGGEIASISQINRAPGWNANFNTVNGVLKDSQHGGRDLPIISARNFLNKYKTLAKKDGIYIAAPGSDIGVANDDPANPFKFDNPYKIKDGQPVDTTDMRYVDFGADISSRAKTTGDPGFNLQFFAGQYRASNIDANMLAKIDSPTFNGVIFSEVPLRVRGNPSRDVVIASNKDIYICGDLNQATDVFQNYADATFFEYQANPINAQKYLDEDTAFRTANINSQKGLYRHRVTVFSNAKVWYDYTRPDMVFENELKPFLEWQLCVKLAGDGGATDKKDVYDKIMKFKMNGNKIDVSNITVDYILDGKPGSILKKADTADKWGSVASAASLTAFCADTTSAALMTYLDSLFAGGTPAVTGKDFIEQTQFKVRDVTNPANFQTKNFLEIINNPASLGKLDVIARAALVDALYEKISTIKPDCMWANHTSVAMAGPDIISDATDATKPSSKASLTGRLYHETGIIFNAGVINKKEYCQFKKPTPNEFEFDRLYMPEITINARIITSDLRRGDSMWHVGNTPQAIYNELGNRYLPNCGYRQYITQVTGIFRLLGSEIFLRENNVLPPMTGQVYWPNLRRKMYDSALTNFEDPQGLTNYGLASWSLNKAFKADYDAY